jgi:hypothetical protein
VFNKYKKYEKKGHAAHRKFAVRSVAFLEIISQLGQSASSSEV